MMKSRSTRTLVLLAMLGVFWLTQYMGGDKPEPAPVPAVANGSGAGAIANAPASERSGAKVEEKAAGPRATGPYRVDGVSIVDINTGKTIRLGTVDLKPTIDRIAAGEKNSHRNDGSIFQNRGDQLPKRRHGYYREYVVPTPGVSGPGPQRLVVGADGEVYYTHDHYDTFIRLPGEK